MQGKITYDTRDKLYGLAIPGTCNSGMSASTTTIVAGELAGYGDDYFNTHYYIQVIKNANSVGNAPESEIRAITDYVSASGTFTCDAFSANVEEEDELYILHSSIMLILSEMPDVGDWVLGDYDLFETDDADGNNERWDVGYISGAANGSAAIASGVYTVNALRTGAGVARYAGNKALPFYADFFRVTTDLDCTFGATDSATAKAIGILISAGTAYDSNNYIAVERQKGTSIDRIQMRYSLNGGAESTTSVAITDDEIAFKIERLGQTWACFYSTIQYEEGFQDWQKIGEMEDPSNYMSNQFTYYMEAFNGAAGDATETASGDFDNFYYWLGTGGGSQYVAGDYDSTWVSPDIDGSVFERIEAIQKAIHITDAAVLTGFEEDGSGATVFNTTVAKYGTETTGGSASVVVDSANLGQSDNYWIGSWIVWLDGNNAGQARPIYDSDQSSTNLSVSPAFGAVTVIGDKFAILTRNKHPIAGLDATTNLFPDDVVGNKTDTADYTYNATTSSMVRLIKGILGSRVVGEGTFTTGGTTTAIDTSRSEGDDYWNGCLLMPVAGDAAFQPRLIVDYDSGTDTFTLDADHPFAPATTTDLYVILAAQGSLVTGADSTNNYTVMDAVGNKTDAVDPMTGANISLMAYMKGQVARGMSIIKGTVTSVTGTPKTIFASTDLSLIHI